MTKSLIKTQSQHYIDTDKIRKGYFIRAKYSNWNKPINGIVAAVSQNVVSVLYIPETGNVTNYYTILADEIAEEKWHITVSADLAMQTGDEL